MTNLTQQAKETVQHWTSSDSFPPERTFPFMAAFVVDHYLDNTSNKPVWIQELYVVATCGTSVLLFRTVRSSANSNSGTKLSGAKFSDTGTRTLVSCVKGKYANHLHHIGAVQSKEIRVFQPYNQCWLTQFWQWAQNMPVGRTFASTATILSMFFH